ncbi:MAG: hypothetical protein LN568_02280 [Rickettsia endosymbiont of Pseudomimeciton antennatum]|nr:hypothetical protein [Rickettsia endosymbiont of Pseudomimeciton antennatum]
MKSKSFTNKDVNKKSKKKLPSLFIGEYYDGYNDIHMFNKNITNAKALDDIQSDLNRSLNLFIQDLDSSTDSINVVNSLREKIGTTQLLPSHLCQELTNTYGLSLGQANYVAMSSTQGSIGGGFILNSIISKVKPDINFMIYRDVLLSKIIIDNSKNVQYIGGQVILFDVSQANNSELLNKGLGVENYLLQTSQDKVILYITVDLGKLGQDLVQELYVQTDIAVQGSTGNKILAKLKKITTKCDNVNPEEIIINYIEFSDNTLYNKGERKERYECLAKENEVWYDIDLNEDIDSNAEDVPSSRQLSINQSFKDNNVNPYLKNISTFCLDTNSIPNLPLAEDDNVSTNSLVDKFKLLSQ